MQQAKICQSAQAKANRCSITAKRFIDRSSSLGDRSQHICYRFKIESTIVTNTRFPKAEDLKHKA